jgi:hypothetical protein
MEAPLSNTDAGYTPESGPEPMPHQADRERKPFPIARLLMSILFAFIAWIAFWVAIVVSVVHWILIAINRDPHPEFRSFVKAVVLYVEQTLGYVACMHDERPFPFGPLPKGEG